MKALFSLTLGMALIALPSGQASGTSLSLGNPLINACYEDALVKRADLKAVSRCTMALNREATTAGERRAATLVNRGILRMVTPNSSGAMLDFDEAVRINPTLSEAWLGKAIESWKAADDRHAIDFANRALELRTDRPELAYLIRGLANEGLGNIRAAYGDLQTARKLAPLWAAPAEHLSRYKVVRR